MASCRVCKRSLSESVYRPGGKYKSCPNCSRIAGVHAYYPTESFGLRTMADGNQIIQSWCPDCRSGGAGKPTSFC